jgi:hypothetical protein
MAGAGPTVLVRASDVTTVHIDGCPYEVVNHHVTPQQAPSLEQPGRHIIQIESSAWLQFHVESQDALPERMIAGWILYNQAWPSLEWEGTPSESLPGTALRVYGPVISGQARQETGIASPLQRQWLELAIQLRDGWKGKPSYLQQKDTAPHPLIYQMQQIVAPRLPGFSRMTKG